LNNNDNTDPEADFVDFATYGEITPSLERTPRDECDLRLWTLTDDTARHLTGESQAMYDEYQHIGSWRGS
jgi:hypothetical protein